MDRPTNPRPHTFFPTENNFFYLSDRCHPIVLVSDRCHHPCRERTQTRNSPISVMGVPAFYRWLSEKYPKIIQDVLEERVQLAGGQGSVRVPFDATGPNPSGLEVDNLYIDMNGIIHPCSHPEVGPQPKNEQEMYENVCHYVDRLVRAVRPRRLLHLAIDGVAPRAKMNQQRSRRFRAAQEARERAGTEVKVRESLEEQGVTVPPPSEVPWDSNVITPGTKFMIELSEYVRFYIRKRIATDKAWKNIKVIFSDASIPGEGEHKIMAHVRQQRGQEGYDPNLVHVLHGLDADLIMLALATHEAHFYILREEVLFGRQSIEATERRREESGFALKQKMLDEAVGAEAMELPENANKPLQRLSVPILREYLANEFALVMNPPFKGEVSFERMIDDIVFMCFFVGNDFLPHLPSLDIRDGALDYLFNVYRRLLPGLGGYLTDHGGKVNLDRVDVILAEVGSIEDYVFEMKHKNEENEKSRRAYHKRNKTTGNKLPAGGLANAPQQSFQQMGRAGRIMAEKEAAVASSAVDVKLQRGYSAKEELRKTLKGKPTSAEDNAKAADELKLQLMSNGSQDDAVVADKAKDTVTSKRKASEISANPEDVIEVFDADDDVDDAVVVDVDDDDDEINGSEEDEAAMDEAKKNIKEKIKEIEQAKLDDFAKNVKDNVRLHEPGWKVGAILFVAEH
jgi:5'-3' exoribonuclease 2